MVDSEGTCDAGEGTLRFIWDAISREFLQRLSPFNVLDFFFHATEGVQSGHFVFVPDFANEFVCPSVIDGG